MVWRGSDRKKSRAGEQANGDYFQFSRYASTLCDFGADVSLFVPKRLKRVLSSLPGPVTMLDSIGPHLRPDFQVYLMSLPYRFHRLGWPTPMTPYLSAEPALRERWLSRIGTSGLRVGIAWQGWSDDGTGGARSFRLEHLRPLTSVPGIRLISLQLGNGPSRSIACCATCQSKRWEPTSIPAKTVSSIRPLSSPRLILS